MSHCVYVFCFNDLSFACFNNNEGQSAFDNEFANREEVGCQTPNKRVSEQEMVSTKHYA